VNRNSLDPEWVLYTVHGWALSKSILGGPSKVFSELAVPPRGTARMILSDCYGELNYPPMIDSFTEHWIRHNGNIYITAKEVHDWVRDYFEIEP
jgi:hypothetical protein